MKRECQLKADHNHRYFKTVARKPYIVRDSNDDVESIKSNKHSEDELESAGKRDQAAQRDLSENSRGRIPLDSINLTMR